MRSASRTRHVCVRAQVLRSRWNRAKQPPVHCYRDKDGKAIDLLLVQDRAIHPVEIRKSADRRARWARAFSTLDRLKPSWSPGGVVCLCRERLPLTEKKVTAILIGLL